MWIKKTNGLFDNINNLYNEEDFISFQLLCSALLWKCLFNINIYTLHMLKQRAKFIPQSSKTYSLSVSIFKKKKKQKRNKVKGKKERKTLNNN